MNIFYDNCSDALSFASDSKSFGIFYSAQNNPNPNIHTHECCEILLCLEGGKNFLIDDKIYPANPGDMFIINQFEAHKITFESDCPVLRYVFEIHPDFIFSASTDESDLSQCFYTRNHDTSHRISLSDSEVSYLKELIIILSKNHGFGDDIIKKATMMQFLAFANKKFLGSHQRSIQPKNSQLKDALLYINEHLCEELSLEMIAKNSYISVNKLCTLFKSSLGTTVTRYIIGKRISYAKKLLKNGYSVSDTAYLSGFGDYANFIRTFTKSVGISPGKYKKETTKGQ